MAINRYGVAAEGRMPDGRWDQRDAVLITYGDMICAPNELPLVSLRRFLSERLKGAVSTVHILPFFPYSSDDGFSVIDYRRVSEELGRWEEIQAIAGEFKLMTDLVLNHVSRQSAWFKDYVSGIMPARHYFIEMDPNTDLSTVVRPRTTPLLTPTATRDGPRHVWTTFSEDQIDLNFANPDVLFEFLDLLLFHISKGARVIRLDAIAYLWKKLDTPCIHLPEAHEVVKLFRDVLDMVAPDVILITETNVPHEENMSYFGEGDEADMIYQFSLPPLLLHALQTGNARHLTRWAADLPALPPGYTYFNFTASHDGIGVRPLEGIIPEGEFRTLVEGIGRRGGHVSTKKNSDGTESPYELNITYFDALADPEQPDPQMHIARFLCSQAIPLALKGIPAIYLHSLTATPNDHEGVERTGRARSINRKRWDAKTLGDLLADRESVTARVFQEYVKRLRVRAEHPAFHPDGDQQVLDVGDRVFAVRRTAPDQSEAIVAVHNVTSRPVALAIDDRFPCLSKAAKWKSVMNGRVRGKTGRKLTLAPYQVCWLLAPPNGTGE